MTDVAPLIDGEALVYALMQRDAPEGSVTDSELDVDTIDALPATIYSLSVEGQTRNGRGLWPATLTLNHFGGDRDTAWREAAAWYASVHLWPFAPMPDPSVGWVSSVDDVDAPSKDSTSAIEGRGITQYTGVYALLLRN